jgi:hypothetical protein
MPLAKGKDERIDGGQARNRYWRQHHIAQSAPRSVTHQPVCVWTRFLHASLSNAVATCLLLRVQCLFCD